MKQYIKIFLIVIVIAICGVTNVYSQSDRHFVRQGNRLYHNQKYDKAEIEYRKAISQNSRNPQAVYNLGCALMMQNKDSLAIIHFQNVSKIETSKIRKAKSFHNIGVICQKHQMYGDAVKAYAEALRNNPNDDETRYNYVLCKRQSKKQNNKQNNKDNKNNKNKNEKENKDKNNNKENKDKNKDKQTQQNKKMSKDNAEQLLNAAIQEEKATQQRLKKAMQEPQRRQLQKNW